MCKTTLQNLIADTSKNEKQFADAVGVSHPKLRYQLKSNNQIQFALQYAVKLGIKRIYGFEYGCEVEVVIG